MLVAGANRGLGRELAVQSLTHGAGQGLRHSRRPELIDIAGVELLRLDVTDPVANAAAAKVASGIGVLISNAAPSPTT